MKAYAETVPDSYARQFDTAIAAARRAGEMLRQEFHRPGGPRGHGGHADMDEIAEAEILRILSADFPEYGYRGEELGLQRQPRDPERHTWVVDPNDGTADYLRGFRGSSVAIALLRAGQPVIGVVYAYCAPDSAGDLLAWMEGGPVLRDGVPVERPWPSKPTEDSTVLVSTWADLKIERNALTFTPLRFRGTPSIAYRMAAIAVGDGDATVALNAPRSWDYAAGHALLIGAGAAVVDADGRTAAYTDDGYSSCAGACYGGPESLTSALRRRDWVALKRAPRSQTSPFILPRRGAAVRDPQTLARAQGCVLGQLAGDSLGSVVEFQTAEQIRREYPAGLARLTGGGVGKRLAGQPTDDSEMALALARAMVRAGRFDARRVWDAYREWYASNPADIGATTRAALSRADGTGADARSESNGALMRVSPIGVALDPERAWVAAHRDAALTHPNPLCREASALLAATISYAIRTGEGARGTYEWALTECVKKRVSTDLREEVERARQAAPSDFDTHPGHLRIAMRNAFYQLLHASGPEACIVDTVARGGDTDTNGAIAGALVGAIHGLRWFPPQWIDRVLTARAIDGLPGVERPRPPECWPIDALRLAERLAVLQSPD